MNIRALMGGLAIGTIIALILYLFVLDRESPEGDALLPSGLTCPACVASAGSGPVAHLRAGIPARQAV